MSHTLVSLPFGIYFSNPFLIFTLAFLTHLLTDSIFHWNFNPADRRVRIYILIFLEILTGLILSRLIVGSLFWSINIWAAIAGGNAPDVLHMIWYYFTPEQRDRWPRWAKAYFWMHEAIQLETKNIVAGLIPQLIIVGAALLLLWR